MTKERKERVALLQTKLSAIATELSDMYVHLILTKEIPMERYRENGIPSIKERYTAERRQRWIAAECLI